eukprot:scaffold13782_cov26-Tisochrysis_lutea.AAC.7
MSLPIASVTFLAIGSGQAPRLAADEMIGNEMSAATRCSCSSGPAPPTPPLRSPHTTSSKNWYRKSARSQGGLA